MKILVAVLSLVLSITICACDRSRSALPTQGLVAYYPFNGNANDESGNKNNGIVKGATLSTDRFGSADRSYNFNGVDDVIDVNSSIGNFGVNDFTISFWLKPNIKKEAGIYILSKRPVCGHASFLDISMQRDGTMGVEIDDSNVNYNILSSTDSLSSDNWHHVSWVRKGPTTYLYTNAKLSGSNTTSGVTNINNDANFIMGSSPCSSGKGRTTFSGLLDDVRIYSRALTEQEIQILNNEAP